VFLDTTPRASVACSLSVIVVIDLRYLL